MRNTRAQGGHERSRGRVGLLFAIPAALYFALWVFLPMGYGIWLSTTNTNFLAPSHFIGASNFTALLSDSTFIHSVIVTGEYVLETVPATLLLAFWIARQLQGIRRGSGFYLAVLLLPFVLPIVATAIVFELLLQPSGLVNQVLHANIAWLTNSRWSLVALSVATIWSLAGYYVVIFLASLHAVPDELREAARLDGATGLGVTRHIELPLLRPAILFSTVTTLAAVLTNFATPYVMTGGGPANATLVLPLLIYRTAFQFSEAGYAAAMAVVVLVVSIVLTAVQFAFLRPNEA